MLFKPLTVKRQRFGAVGGIVVRDAANRAESLALYGQWLEEHRSRLDEALRLWAALFRTPDVHATLKDELLKRFAEHGLEATALPQAAVDLTLSVEQALAAAEVVPQA